MKVQASTTQSHWLTEELKKIGFSEKSQIDVKSSQIYEVHAIVVWSNSVFFQIVGDSGIISWVPSGVFKVVDHTMPTDWMVNRLDEEVPLVIGPGFLILDKSAYSEMVELDPEKVRQFKQRILQRENDSNASQ